MIVPRFFIVEVSGPGRVHLHVPPRSLPPGSRESIFRGQPCKATIRSEARSWKDCFPADAANIVVREGMAWKLRTLGLLELNCSPLNGLVSNRSR